MFHPGERVELVHTDDPHTRLRPGDTGTVTRHDQATTGEVVHVAWDDGSRLSMCLDAGDRIRRISTTATPTRPHRSRAGGCLLGELHCDGHRYTAVPVAHPTEPADLIPALRQLWWDKADGEPGRFTNFVLTDAWLVLDPTGHTAAGAGERVEGIGVSDPNPAGPVPIRGDLHHRATEDTQPGWLYLLDHDWEQVLVYEATVHGAWLPHSRHDLAAPPGDPVMIAPLGDAATPAGHAHRWRPATVALPGLDQAWPAEICTLEHRRGLVVARFHPDVFAAVISLADSLHYEPLPDPARPVFRLDSGGLHVTWYPGSGHEQTQYVALDAEGRLVVAGDILPWTLPAETTPPDRSALVNGVPPQVREWVTEAGFHACHPNLAGYPLPLVCAAVTACCPQMTAVIATDTTRFGGPVWLVAPSHALILTPTGHEPALDRVTLPRPLAGSWAGDPPVQVLTADQVAQACAALADAFNTLTRSGLPNPPSST
jgi:hypothetical protein